MIQLGCNEMSAWTKSNEMSAWTKKLMLTQKNLVAALPR
jgi:hypothetical protein